MQSYRDSSRAGSIAAGLVFFQGDRPCAGFSTAVVVFAVISFALPVSDFDLFDPDETYHGEFPLVFVV